jgi:hypothetical protein
LELQIEKNHILRAEGRAKIAGPCPLWARIDNADPWLFPFPGQGLKSRSLDLAFKGQKRPKWAFFVALGTGPGPFTPGCEWFNIRGTVHVLDKGQLVQGDFRGGTTVVASLTLFASQQHRRAAVEGAALIQGR